MDTSNEYIKMCEEAKLLQDLRIGEDDYLKHNYGDYFYRPEIGKWFIAEFTIEIRRHRPGDIWLPRQDQLIELLQSLVEGHKYKVARLADIIQNQTNGARSYFDTFEKILLTIYMQRIHKKWWDTDDNIWINT